MNWNLGVSVIATSPGASVRTKTMSAAENVSRETSATDPGSHLVAAMTFLLMGLYLRLRSSLFDG